MEFDFVVWSLGCNPNISSFFSFLWFYCDNGNIFGSGFWVYCLDLVLQNIFFILIDRINCNIVGSGFWICSLDFGLQILCSYCVAYFFDCDNCNICGSGFWICCLDLGLQNK